MKLTRSINETLRRAVRNFNSKIKRLEGKDLLLPEKANMKIIKSRITNKWDLNREIDRLQRFSERGMEKTVTTKSGVQISKYELTNLKKEQNRLVAKLDRPDLEHQTIERLKVDREITKTFFNILANFDKSTM